MGAFLLALIVGVFSASPFGERDVAYAQTQDDNRLRSLSITGVSLSPGFNRDTIAYSARVPFAKMDVEVRATTGNRNAMVAIVDSGTTLPADSPNTITQTVPVAAGANTTIRVVVAPEIENGAAQVYTINVYRLAADPKSMINTLETLELRAGADAADSETNLISGFMGDTAKYNVAVRHDIEKVTLVATAGADNPGAIVQVGSVRYNQSITSRNIDLNGKGSKTEIRVIVTPEDGSGSETYAITVYRERATLSADNNLRNLSLGRVYP